MSSDSARWGQTGPVKLMPDLLLITYNTMLVPPVSIRWVQAWGQSRCSNKPAYKHLIISQADEGLRIKVSLLILPDFCQPPASPIPSSAEGVSSLKLSFSSREPDSMRARHAAMFFCCYICAIQNKMHTQCFRLIVSISQPKFEAVLIEYFLNPCNSLIGLQTNGAVTGVNAYRPRRGSVLCNALENRQAAYIRRVSESDFCAGVQ